MKGPYSTVWTTLWAAAFSEVATLCADSQVAALCADSQVVTLLCEPDMQGESNQNLSGDEVYYAAWYLLVTFKNSCHKCQCQEGLESILYSYNIGDI
jgi:hypothetical protein